MTLVGADLPLDSPSIDLTVLLLDVLPDFI